MHEGSVSEEDLFFGGLSPVTTYLP